MKIVCSLMVSVVLLAAPMSLVAQTFDERMSDWPVDLKINGTVMASSNPNVTDEQTEYFFTAAGGEEANIVSIHFGETGESTGAAMDWSKVATHVHFAARDDSIQVDNASNDSDEPSTIQNALKNATGVRVTSSGTLNRDESQALDSIRDSLIGVIDRGGILYASGPFCQRLGKHHITGGQLLPDDSVHPTVQPGLNLIPDCVIQTDFENENAKPRLMSVLGSHPRTIGIGLDKETGLILRGRKIRAIGKNQAHFYTMANEQLPFRTKSIASPPERRANPYQFVVDLTAWRRDAIDRTLELFPVADREKPFVENGTLIIIGGGGMPEGMMERFIGLAGGKNARLVYVPCSERDEVTRSDRRMVEAWKKAGVASATVIHTKDRNQANSDSEFLEPLKKATGIFFGGGRQWNFSDSYYGTEAHRLMKKVVANGGVIAGSSAGASIQGRYLARANPIGNFDIMAPGYERGGLGFISGVAIDQHFSQRGRQPDMSSLVNRYPQLLGIGLDERTAIVVTESVAEVAGVGKVFFYDRSQFPSHADPDYLALEAGAKFDLATRKVIEE